MLPLANPQRRGRRRATANDQDGRSPPSLQRHDGEDSNHQDTKTPRFHIMVILRPRCMLFFLCVSVALW